MKIRTRFRAAALLQTVRRNYRPLLIGIGIGVLMYGLLSAGLVNSKSAGPNVSAQESKNAGQTWTCAMHPQIRKSEPGACPICGMDLVPVESGASAEESTGGRLQLSPRAVKLAQLRTTEVVRQGNSRGEVRLLGRIEQNEETVKNITAWIGGRIDRLLVNTTGERVVAGQKVALLYSPEVYTAHQDLITSTAQLKRMQQGTDLSKRAAEAAQGAARQRLALLGVPDDEIARMQSQEKPTTSISIRSPFSGTVMERFATEGSYVTTGARLYAVANLSSLWIELDAYESDLPLLSVNQTVKIEVEAYPGESFEGKINFIEPTLDSRLRTSKVRVVVDNKDGRLRPGMFAQAVVASSEGVEGAPLVIPASAPLLTGRRAIVYVEVPGEQGLVYDARTVRLGPRLGEVYPVVAGLSEGERVVTRGAFALDADLQIKGGASMMRSADDSKPSVWDDAISLPQSKLRPLRDITDFYLDVQKALARDDLGTAKQSAAALRAALPEVSLDKTPQVVQAWEHLEGMLSGGSQHIAQADSLEQARKGFEHLSGALIMVLRTFGNPTDKTLALAHCPMARGSEGANWIQEGSALDNSYFGESMRSCGDVQQTLKPGDHLSTAKKERSSVPPPAEGHRH